MNKPKYKIINTLATTGEISNSAKHRIGRDGWFIKLTKGMGFRFLYDYEGDNMLKSSVVNKIEETENLLRVHTLNTIYEFEKIV